MSHRPTRWDGEKKPKSIGKLLAARRLQRALQDDYAAGIINACGKRVVAGKADETDLQLVEAFNAERRLELTARQGATAAPA